MLYSSPILILSGVIAAVEYERHRQAASHQRRLQEVLCSPPSSSGPQQAASDPSAGVSSPVLTTPVRALRGSQILVGSAASPTSWVTVDLMQPPPVQQHRVDYIRWANSEPRPACASADVVLPSASAPPPLPAASAFRGLGRGQCQLLARRRLRGNFA